MVLRLLLTTSLLLAAAEPAWQTKPIATWTEDDAHAVLNDSPWAKSVTPKISKTANPEQSRMSGGMGQMGGLSMGMPGMGGGMGGGGMSRRGGGRNPQTSDTSSDTPSSIPPHALTVRWESALPVQAAELKARNVNSPTMDENHYAVAVYGIPSRLIKADSTALDDQLRDKAAIKREGKKDLKPSRVEVIPRDDDTVVVYFFPRSKEITRQDNELEFNAQIVNLQFSVSFTVTAMNYQGKLEL
jgi:hypothetical protein